MIQFHETGMGQRFYQATMPELVKAIQEQNRLLEEQIEATKAQTEALKKIAERMR